MNNLDKYSHEKKKLKKKGQGTPGHLEKQCLLVRTKNNPDH